MLARRVIVCIVFAILLFSERAFAQNCENILAVSKIVNITISASAAVEQHAYSFCNEYRKHREDASTSSFGASYEFLSATFGTTTTTVDQVASRYCSASSDYAANRDAYKRYAEAISPNAYDAYEQCVKLSERGLVFDVNIASVLPKELSLSVSFVSGSEDDTVANVRLTPSSDVHCLWDEESKDVRSMASGSTAVFRCMREDQTRRSYVRITRMDQFEGEMVFPWSAYDEAGVSVNSLAAIQSRLDALMHRMSGLRNEVEAAIPEGTVAAFSVPSCPSGWSQADGKGGRPNLSGRFLVGVGQYTQDADRRFSLGQTGGSHRMRLGIKNNEAKCCSGDAAIAAVTVVWHQEGKLRVHNQSDNQKERWSNWMNHFPPYAALLFCVKE